MKALAIVAVAAAAFPDRDASEIALLPGPAQSRGTWATAPALTLTDNPGHGDPYWVASGPTLGDGLVRAEIDAGDALALLFRVTLDPDQPEDYSGYGLVLGADAVELWRWDQGVGLPVAPGVPTPSWEGHGRLALSVIAAGPWMAASVHDAGTLDLLASLTAHDTSYLQGAVGILAMSRNRAPPPVYQLSLGSGGPPIPAPFGADRLVRLRAEDLATLPADLRALAVAPAAGGTVELVADALQAERIRHLVAPLAVTDEVAFRHEAPGLRGDGGYPGPAEAEAALRALHAAHPDRTHLEEIGRSHEGRPLLALKISDRASVREDEPAVLLNGAHHGNELLSVDYVLDAAALLLEGGARGRRWVEQLEVWCVPVVNPDALARFLDTTRWAGRKNARDTNGDGRIVPWDGIDLNRNYPFRWGSLGEVGSRSFHRMPMFRGPGPGSEPEVQAIMKLAARERFVAAVSFHTQATAILSPYTVDGVDNPEPDVAWAVAESMAAAAPVQPSGKRYRVRRKLYPVDGTDQDWLLHTFGTLAYIVEGSAKNPRNPDTRAASVQGTRPVWQTLLDRLVDGPAVHGHTVDRAGAPVEAVVAVEGIALRAGERWTSRPADGRFERILPAAGAWTITAEAEGYAPVTETVRVDGRSEVELVLKRR